MANSMFDQQIYGPSEYLKLPEKYAHLSPEEYLEALIEYIERYNYLIDVHISHFLTHDQWGLLHEEWRNALLPSDHHSADHEEWINSIIRITTDCLPNEEWPESLKAFIRDTTEIALPRTMEDSSLQQQCIEDLDRRIKPGMTLKKIHEVERMAPVIKKLAAKHKVESIVDLGAGQGYLSRALAFKTQLKVLAVDSSEIQTCGAKKFDEKVAKFLKKQDKILQLYHVTELITPENAPTVLSRWSNINSIATDDTDENDSFSDERKTESDSAKSEKWLLTGLHTCGDLATMMLELFVENKDITCFVNVGCCYHFLTEGPNADEDGSHCSSNVGFPLSSSLKNKNYKLGPRGKMLACQAPVRWTDQKDETLKAFEHHFFRTLLQLIMVEKGLTDLSDAPIVGRLNNKKDFVSFPVYVKAALKRLKVPEDSISDEEAQSYYNKLIKKQADKQIMILWTLRTLLAPVLESIILIDRWLYLKENIKDSATKQVYLWPLFDPIISPRNMVIVARK